MSNKQGGVYSVITRDSSKRGAIVVIRHYGQRTLCWLVIGVIALSMIAVIGATSPNGDLVFELTVIGFFCVGLWFVVLIGIQPRIILRGDRLVIMNPFTRWNVPWCAVRRVEVLDALEIGLVDGRTIKPSIGLGSLLGAIGNNRRQKRYAEILRPYIQFDTRSDGNAVVTRHVDLHPYKFVIVLVIIEVLAALLTHVQ